MVPLPGETMVERTGLGRDHPMTNGASIWSGANKAGLVLLAIAAAVNLIPMPPPEGAGGPPTPVLIASAVLGLVALIAVVVAWSKNSRNCLLYTSPSPRDS